MLEKDASNGNFLKKILWSDESTFTRDGTTNFHNLHHYATQNPHVKFQTKHQNRFSVNVWAGVIGKTKILPPFIQSFLTINAIGNRIIGPFYLPQRLDANAYLNFLKNDVQNSIEELPLNVLNGMFFQQDGCPVHSSRVVTNYLNEEFGTNWIGRHGPIKWPPRSPDLTPLDYYVWGRAKDLVYNEEILNCDHLKRKIELAFEIIREEISFQTTTTEIRRRYSKCIDAQGGHFEHL